MRLAVDKGSLVKMAHYHPHQGSFMPTSAESGQSRAETMVMDGLSVPEMANVQRWIR